MWRGVQRAADQKEIDALACELARLAGRNERLEVVIHGIRRMAESGCSLKDIIDACEAELPESLPGELGGLP
jgi:Flp pilus assembly protein TadB